MRHWPYFLLTKKLGQETLNCTFHQRIISTTVLLFLAPFIALARSSLLKRRPRNSLLYSRMLCRFLLLSRFCLSAGKRTPPPRRSRRFEVRKKRTFTYTFLSLTAFKRRLEFWKIWRIVQCLKIARKVAFSFASVNFCYLFDIVRFC